MNSINLIGRLTADPELKYTSKDKKAAVNFSVAYNASEEHVDFFNVELEKGDIVLMCSDGLTNMLEDQEIRMIVSGQRDIIEKAQKLVDMANQHGGKDNIAVILIEPFADGGAE